MQEEHDNARCQPQSEHGDTTAHAPSPFNKGAPSEQQWGRRYRTRGTPTSNGRVNTAAPALPCNAAPPHNATPSSTMPPTHHHCEGGVIGGYPTTRTPQTDTHTVHAHTPSNEQCATRRSTHAVCTGSRGHRPHTLDSAGQQHHTPPPFHTPHSRVWTPSTHLLSHCSRSQ